MTQKREGPGGALTATGPSEVIQSPSEYAESRSAVHVSALMTGAAGALGVMPNMVELLTPDAARRLAHQRLREVEGLIEVLGRHQDALEAFSAFLADLPAGSTIGAALEVER